MSAQLLLSFLIGVLVSFLLGYRPFPLACRINGENRV
jgi:hypothetical protein